MSGPTLKKCKGESAHGVPCSNKWACQRYYISLNGAGWLENPSLYDYGCGDFVSFDARDGRRNGAQYQGWLPGAGGGD